MASAAACHLGAPEPIALAGRAPTVVAIWPHVFGVERGEGIDWFAGLVTSLRRRGYGVVAPRVAAAVLHDAGVEAVEPGPAAGPALRADAVLELHVRTFDSEGEGRRLRSARWDFEWRLVSLRGEGVLWRHSHHGNWRASDQLPQDALSRGDAIDPSSVPPIVPIGGQGGPGFSDVAELMSFLHRDAMLFLPERSGVGE